MEESERGRVRGERERKERGEEKGGKNSTDRIHRDPRRRRDRGHSRVRVRDDLGPAVAEHGDGGVGRAEVEADGEGQRGRLSV